MKILMYFHGGSKNRGCEAIVRTGVAIIKKENPDAIVDLASWEPETDKIIPLIDNILSDQPREFKRFTSAWFANLYQTRVFKNDSYAFQKIHGDIIEKIPDYDIFLSVGGDNYCYGEQPGIYEINRCIKKGNKKLVLWGASIGEEDLSEEKIEDLKSFDLILARESLTYNILKSKGVINVELCADGAFTLDKDELPLPKEWEDNKMIGFNYSPLVWKKNKDSQQAAKNLVKHIIDTTDFKIVFTPHVIMDGNNDYDCLLEFYNEFKDTNRVIILPNNLNATQYKGYISRMRFFIGARTHATIAAYSSLVPTMVLGYSVKSKGIAKDIFGEQKFVLALNDISNTEKLTTYFDQMIQEEDTLRETLKNKIPEIKKISHKAAEYLFKI